jgi:hypothetical protein
MSKGFKNLHVRIDAEDHNFLMAQSIRSDVSATKIITNYIRYLRKIPPHKRKLLDETTDTCATL